MLKKIVSVFLLIIMLLNLCACGSVSDTAKDIGEKATKVGKSAAEKAGDIAESTLETAGNIADSAVEGATSAFNKASNAVSNLSLPDFQKGFEVAAGFFGASMASLGGQAYVQEVADAIKKLETNILNRPRTGIPKIDAGNIAEEWHGGTFNIDAIAKGSSNRAKVNHSQDLGSPDITVGETDVSLKYYSTAESTAKAQAQSYIERYNQYVRNNKNGNPLTMDEWLKSNDIDIPADSPELNMTIYADQIRIVPSDQLNDMVEWLERQIKTESSRGRDASPYLTKADLDVLNNLTDRLKAEDGTESIPLSKSEATAIAKAAKDGDLDLQKYGVNLNTSITAEYIAKQSIKAGATSGIIEAALVLGPEIYEIIKHGIENGELDEDQLLDAGIDGLSAGADGFLKGSISNAIVVLCRAGKLGAEYTNPSPELIGTFTVLVIDAVKYGIMLSKGLITTSAYIDLMAQEVVVSAGSLGGMALMSMVFPGVTLAILAGSLVGGLVVSAGYTTGKTYVLALIENSGVDLLLPIEDSAEVLASAKESNRIKVKEALSDMKDVAKKIKNNITIKVFDLKDTVQI